MTVPSLADSTGGPQLPPFDPARRQRRMRALSRGMDLYLHIEDLAEEWLRTVSGRDLSRDEAIGALVAGLKGGLRQDAPKV